MGTRGPISRKSPRLVESDKFAPAPDEGWHEITVQQWEDYWDSDVAGAAEEADLPLVYRLFRYRDEHTRLQMQWAGMADDERVTEGSNRKDALRLHPIADRMRHLEADMLKLEDRLGLSPLSRARLGIEVGNAQITWDQVNKKLESAPARSALPVGKVIDVVVS